MEFSLENVSNLTHLIEDLRDFQEDPVNPELMVFEENQEEDTFLMDLRHALLNSLSTGNCTQTLRAIVEDALETSNG